LRFAPEGWPFIGLGWALVAAAIWATLRWGGGGLPWVAVGVLTLIGIWLFIFFRDPLRPGPRGDALVIAPADGRIVSVVATDEPSYLHAPATRISIFMNVFDVHVNRYPVSGTVEYRHYNPGKFLHAATDKASLDNEQSSIGVRGPHGPVLVRQIAGQIARRIVTDGEVGARATQGERLGMIRFGSRVDVYIPSAERPAVQVKVGETVSAGVTVLARYPQ